MKYMYVLLFLFGVKVIWIVVDCGKEDLYMNKKNSL